MLVEKMHDEVLGKSLNVMALLSPDGWMYLAEVIDPQPAGEVRTRACNHTCFPSALSALAQGMAYARWIACDDAAGFDPDAEITTDVRVRH